MAGVRAVRMSGGAVFAAIAFALAGYGVWLIVTSSQPVDRDIPRAFFVVLGLTAIALASVFAFPAAVLFSAPRAKRWWIAGAVCCAFAAAFLVWVVLFGVVEAAPLLALAGALGLGGVVLYVRTLIAAGGGARGA